MFYLVNPVFIIFPVTILIINSLRGSGRYYEADFISPGQ
jgi:hypothetical protein